VVGHDHRLSNWLHVVVGVTGSSVAADAGDNDGFVAGAGCSSGYSSSTVGVRGNLWARQIGGAIYFYGLETIPANSELVVRPSASYSRQVQMAMMTKSAEANSPFGEFLSSQRCRVCVTSRA
jgi:hypothetical protein